MKKQFLQKNDLFDKDFKSYAIFVEVIYEKRVNNFCSSIANHEDFLSPGGSHYQVFCSH